MTPQPRSEAEIREDLSFFDERFAGMVGGTTNRLAADVEPLLAALAAARTERDQLRAKIAEVRRDMEHMFNHSPEGSDAHELAGLVVAALSEVSL